MTDDEWRVDQGPAGMSEAETLKRLTPDEKRQLADDAVKDFPHLSHEMVHEWLEGAGAADDVPVGDSILDKVDALLDAEKERVESGDDPEALDKYIYGYLYEMHVCSTLDLAPEEVAGRDPLEVWEGVYDG